MKYLKIARVKKYIENYRRDHDGILRFLDVGGGSGKHHKWAEGYKYYILEIDPKIDAKNVIHGDICDCTLLTDNSWDIVFSNNVFEHLKEPWNAALECIRITKSGGLLIHLAPFAWRYHPVPEDYFRYSHKGLEYLFTRSGQVETFLCGYDISQRRKDHRGGKIKGDVPPIDDLGGWREHWTTIFVGGKM